MKLEAKGWPAIIAMGIVTWPYWLIYGILMGVGWVLLAILCYGILMPVEKLCHWIKRKYHESVQNRRRN